MPDVVSRRTAHSACDGSPICGVLTQRCGFDTSRTCDVSPRSSASGPACRRGDSSIRLRVAVQRRRAHCRSREGRWRDHCPQRQRSLVMVRGRAGGHRCRRGILLISSSRDDGGSGGAARDGNVESSPTTSRPAARIGRCSTPTSRATTTTLLRSTSVPTGGSWRCTRPTRPTRSRGGGSRTSRGAFGPGDRKARSTTARPCRTPTCTRPVTTHLYTFVRTVGRDPHVLGIE